MFPQVAIKFFESRSKGPVTFEAPVAAAPAPAPVAPVKPAAAPAAAPAPVVSAAPAAASAGGASSYVVNVDSKDFKVVCEFKFELQKVDSGS